MGLITSVLGSTIGKFLTDRSYWAVKLSNNKWCSELDRRFYPSGEPRGFDWTLDLVNTGDIRRVRELWLFCPPNPGHPLGQTAHLPILEDMQPFQFKVNNVNAIGEWGRTFESQIIGRVTDKATGACDCFIWDAPLAALGTYTSSIYTFGSWREGIAPIGALSLDVQGLRLD